jgi:hypothetical protein
MTAGEDTEDHSAHLSGCSDFRRNSSTFESEQPLISLRNHMACCSIASLRPSLPHGEESHSITRRRSLLVGVAERGSFAWGYASPTSTVEHGVSCRGLVTAVFAAE